MTSKPEPAWLIRVRERLAEHVPLPVVPFPLANRRAVELAQRVEAMRAVGASYEIPSERVDAGVAEALDRARTRPQSLDYWLDQLEAWWRAEYRWRSGG
jgi:hypothetical protein